MLQLKPTLQNFIKCEVGDGTTASFWYDNWTDFGQLITFLGVAGPSQLRVRRSATVIEASRNGDWNLPAARSIKGQSLMVAHTELPAPVVSRGPDMFLWRKASGNYSHTFSSKETWEQVRHRSPMVPWAEIVWFKQHVPRYSFIAWLAMLNRLPTQDKLHRWGMNVPTSCVLCSSGVESHAHLFFECPFSTDLWGFLAAKFIPNPPCNLSAVVSWIASCNSPPQANTAAILKLLLTSILYHVWKERNSRIFTNAASTIHQLWTAVDRAMRDRLMSFTGPCLHSSLLLTYFSHVSPVSF
ncbi:PREDICTED: uncharacterized protein LOC109129138 [Camelina sativa]|uniref:Uncharacterized protein LOC109129138 n=1 Tax=Camelina sativa TaxID=90675 RepID=A0ABM1QZY9_CAMSA|nr:PREDICTED: uncharacterized protein LOC109129138 [Camelina sativa]